MTGRRTSSLILGVIMGIIAVLWFIPVYYMVINSFKPLKDVIFTTAAFPKSFYLDNIIKVWKGANFFRLFLNSFIITALSVAGIVLCSSMAGYKLARMGGKLKNGLMGYFILTLIIPFQAVMIPLVVQMRNMGMIDSIWGLCLTYVAFGSPMPIFLYSGYVQSVPRSMEESATIDGSGPIRTFFSVIFPLLRPMTSTVIILQSLYIWNDFLLPLITLQSESYKTIQLGITAQFFGQYAFKWNLGITAMLLASIPMLILYLFMQRFIIEGVVQGAVKG